MIEGGDQTIVRAFRVCRANRIYNLEIPNLYVARNILSSRTIMKFIDHGQHHYGQHQNCEILIARQTHNAPSIVRK